MVQLLSRTPREARMTLKQFLAKQFIDVIQWNEPEDGMLAYRYPMQDMEIQNGGQPTVREAQLALFVNEGTVADGFGPRVPTMPPPDPPPPTDPLPWVKQLQR